MKIKFWDTLKKTKISTFASMIKKRKTKAVDEKIVSISADRDLFGRLVIVAITRSVNLKEVLSYELSAVPYSLAHRDSTMRKTDKSVLMKVLESKVEVMPRCPYLKVAFLPLSLLMEWLCCTCYSLAELRHLANWVKCIIITPQRRLV